jgi:hypothetical protein
LSPTMPSGPGRLLARVSTMKRWLGGGGFAGSSAVPASPSAPTISGSSALRGTKTVPLLPLVTRSRPWSKNWPNSVNHELYGAERPSSGARLGRKISFGVSGRLSWSIRVEPSFCSAALTAAGLFSV